MKHSKAHSARVSIGAEGSALVFRVSDKGIGMDPDSPVGKGHSGLANIKSRTLEMGGKLTIESGAEAGTDVIFTIPSYLHKDGKL